MSERFRGDSALAMILAALFFCAAPAMNAQEAPPAGEGSSLPPVELPDKEQSPEEKSPGDENEDEAEPEMEISKLTPEQNRVNMDIRTSTLSELAAWCRTLGLSESGTSSELAQRLREHFQISEQTPRGRDNRKIITIESARSTEYFKIEEIDEEYARLSGEVRISLKDGDAIHRIHAWNILFNRTRNIITASGGVEYIKEEGEKIETFRGESITVDLDNWSSVFLGGVSERSLQSDNTTYLFAGTVISRDDEEVTILNRASISSAHNEDSLWSLSASRVWLLPGSDFAIFNAVLKVGEIPVLYIPFFYYAADELMFHPVIGYRTREGNFVQTTTYILGRPKANTSSQSSLTRILGNSSDMEKRREGLFLRSTGKKTTDTAVTSLKAMVDYYANLGAYLGVDLDLPARDIFGASSVTMGVGLTRTVSLDVSSGSYTPFFPNYDGSSDWNNSNLFSAEVPFRYRFKGETSARGQYGNFSLSIPFYSDPLVDSDFMNRSEEMDWVNMIQQGAAMEEEITQTSLGNYSWKLSGQITPRLSNMAPYINTLTISNIFSSVSFRSLDRRNSYPSTDVRRSSPSSFFYVPESATLYSISGSITGTPFSLGGTSAGKTGANASGARADGTSDAELFDPLKNIGIPRSPFESNEKENAQKKDTSNELIPPVLSQRFDLPKIGSNKFSVDYRLAPSSASTLKFDYSKWTDHSEIDWGEITSIISNFSGDGNITFKLDHSENFYSTSFSYKGNGTWRQYNYMNEEAQDFLDSKGEPDPDKIAAAKLQEYRQSFFSTSYNTTTSLRPLYQNSIFSASSLQYTLEGLAVKSDFIGTGDEPEWELIWGEWDKEKLTTHQASANLSALVMDKNQTLSLMADLPPRDAALTMRTSLRFWFSETDANMKILFPFDSDERKLEPLHATERLVISDIGNFTQNIVVDMEEKEITSFTSSLNLTKWGLTMTYNASQIRGYEYIPEGQAVSSGWTERDAEPTLQSNSFKLNYSKTLSKKNLWDDRLQFSVSTTSNLNFDLQRYTNSNFAFTLGVTVGIKNFMDISLSTNSENAYIYRYFKDLPFFRDAPIDLASGPQNNVFLDLLNSFRFDNDDLRRSSGFKMKGFVIKAVHYLGDWTAELDWTIVPERPANSRQYEMNNKISFVVRWIPISELKSDISYNKQNTPAWIVQ